LLKFLLSLQHIQFVSGGLLDATDIGDSVSLDEPLRYTLVLFLAGPFVLGGTDNGFGFIDGFVINLSVELPTLHSLFRCLPYSSSWAQLVISRE
jgi:hypothetical protein